MVGWSDTRGYRGEARMSSWSDLSHVMLEAGGQLGVSSHPRLTSWPALTPWVNILPKNPYLTRRKMPNFRLILSKNMEKCQCFWLIAPIKCLFCWILPKKAYHSTPTSPGIRKNIHPCLTLMLGWRITPVQTWGLLSWWKTVRSPARPTFCPVEKWRSASDIAKKNNIFMFVISESKFIMHGQKINIEGKSWKSCFVSKICHHQSKC